MESVLWNRYGLKATADRGSPNGDVVRCTSLQTDAGAVSDVETSLRKEFCFFNTVQLVDLHFIHLKRAPSDNCMFHNLRVSFKAKLSVLRKDGLRQNKNNFSSTG
jgi:hypothetical protein